jgi:hypothetical protein
VVTWRAALVLLVVLIGLAVLAYVSRPQPRPPTKPTPSFLCETQNAVLVRIDNGARVTELQRPTTTDAWRVTQPVQTAADSDGVQTLMGSISSIRVLNTLEQGSAPAGTGLDKPRETLTCRVESGASYNLSVGNQSLDSSGYYARKSGDSRVFVISAVAVDALDRALAGPPVKPSPSPTAPA